MPSFGAGLGLDLAVFDDQGDLQPKNARNMLRPETVESLFYMWRVTGEPKYREWGWQIFQAFQRHSRTPEGAYATVEVGFLQFLAHNEGVKLQGI